MRTEWDPSSRELARAHVELLAQHGWKTARERAYEAYRMYCSVAGAPVVLHGQRLLDVDRPAAPEPTPRPALPMAEPVLSYEALQAMAAEATAKLGRACR